MPAAWLLACMKRTSLRYRKRRRRGSRWARVRLLGAACLGTEKGGSVVGAWPPRAIGREGRQPSATFWDTVVCTHRLSTVSSLP